MMQGEEHSREADRAPAAILGPWRGYLWEIDEEQGGEILSEEPETETSEKIPSLGGCGEILSEGQNLGDPKKTTKPQHEKGFDQDTANCG